MGLIRKELEIIITTVSVLSVCNEYEKTGTIGSPTEGIKHKINIFSSA